MKKLIVSDRLAAAETRRIHHSNNSPLARLRRRWRYPLSAVLLLAAISVWGNASGTNSPSDPSPVLDTSPFQPLLDGLLGKYGWVTTVILVIGSLRLVFKPVMLAIENYVKQTPSPTDDARIEKFEAGPVYKIIAFVLDLGASIKLSAIAPRSINTEKE